MSNTMLFQQQPTNEFTVETPGKKMNWFENKSIVIILNINPSI